MAVTKRDDGVLLVSAEDGQFSIDYSFREALLKTSEYGFDLRDANDGKKLDITKFDDPERGGDAVAALKAMQANETELIAALKVSITERILNRDGDHDQITLTDLDRIRDGFMATLSDHDLDGRPGEYLDALTAKAFYAAIDELDTLEYKQSGKVRYAVREDRISSSDRESFKTDHRESDLAAADAIIAQAGAVGTAPAPAEAAPAPEAATEGLLVTFKIDDNGTDFTYTFDPSLKTDEQKADYLDAHKDEISAEIAKVLKGADGEITRVEIAAFQKSMQEDWDAGRASGTLSQMKINFMTENVLNALFIESLEQPVIDPEVAKVVAAELSEPPAEMAAAPVAPAEPEAPANLVSFKPSDDYGFTFTFSGPLAGTEGETPSADLLALRASYIQAHLPAIRAELETALRGDGSFTPEDIETLETKIGQNLEYAYMHERSDIQAMNTIAKDIIADMKAEIAPKVDPEVKPAENPDPNLTASLDGGETLTIGRYTEDDPAFSVSATGFASAAELTLYLAKNGEQVDTALRDALYNERLSADGTLSNEAADAVLADIEKQLHPADGSTPDFIERTLLERAKGIVEADRGHVPGVAADAETAPAGPAPAAAIELKRGRSGEPIADVQRFAKFAQDGGYAPLAGGTVSRIDNRAGKKTAWSMKEMLGKSYRELNGMTTEQALDELHEKMANDPAFRDAVLKGMKEGLDDPAMAAQVATFLEHAGVPAELIASDPSAAIDAYARALDPSAVPAAAAPAVEEPAAQTDRVSVVGSTGNGYSFVASAFADALDHYDGTEEDPTAVLKTVEGLPADFDAAAASEALDRLEKALRNHEADSVTVTFVDKANGSFAEISYADGQKLEIPQTLLDEIIKASSTEEAPAMKVTPGEPLQPVT